MTVQIATVDDASRARYPISDEVDGPCLLWKVQFGARSYTDPINEQIAEVSY